MWVDVSKLSKAEQSVQGVQSALNEALPPDPGRRWSVQVVPAFPVPAQLAGQIMGTWPLGGGAGRQLLAQGGPAGPAEAAILIRPDRGC